MQVHGSVSHNVMNIMGAAVMEEQFRKHLQDFVATRRMGEARRTP